MSFFRPDIVGVSLFSFKDPAVHPSWSSPPGDPGVTIWPEFVGVFVFSRLISCQLCLRLSTSSV
jgi:hypothetical protein